MHQHDMAENQYTSKQNDGMHSSMQQLSHPMMPQAPVPLSTASPINQSMAPLAMAKEPLNYQGIGAESKHQFMSMKPHYPPTYGPPDSYGFPPASQGQHFHGYQPPQQLQPPPQAPQPPQQQPLILKSHQLQHNQLQQQPQQQEPQRHKQLPLQQQHPLQLSQQQQLHLQQPQLANQHIFSTQLLAQPQSHLVVPGQTQLSRLLQIPLRQHLSPQYDLSKGLHLHPRPQQYQQGPFVKFELDLNGYPMMGNGQNLVVYTPFPPDGLNENDHIKHTSPYPNNQAGQTFVPSRQSQLLNSNSQQQDPVSPKLKLPINPDKPYVCSHESCTWAFARQSDLRRHAKSHKTPTFHCPYWKGDPTCHRNGGSFNRLDVLKRHLRLVHFVKDKQPSNGINDPGWCRSCQKLFASSKDFIDHCVDCSTRVLPAEWKPLEQKIANDTSNMDEKD